MTFTYPAVVVPHDEDNGYHVYFPDLESCEADGPDLDDALQNAREAAYDWICVELEEEMVLMPEVSHAEDIKLPKGGFLRNIMVTVKLLPDND